MGEGAKGKPRATDWEGSGRGTAAERIMGRKAVERVGCDRMGGNAETHWEGYMEEQERLLGRKRVNTATDWEGCLELRERLLGRMRVNAATDGKVAWNYGRGYWEG